LLGRVPVQVSLPFKGIPKLLQRLFLNKNGL
jgi:hypothetical protein